MDKGKTESSSIRGVRGSRGTRISSIRSKPSERPSSPPNKNPPSNPEQSHPIRDNQANGSRIVRPRGRVRGRVMRRFNRPRPRIINRRFRRVPNMMRGRRGMRRRFRPGFGFFRRRFNFARRSIFIKGLPKKITEDNLMGMLKKEGRVLRLTLLKDDSGESSIFLLNLSSFMSVLLPDFDLDFDISLFSFFIFSFCLFLLKSFKEGDLELFFSLELFFIFDVFQE